MNITFARLFLNFKKCEHIFLFHSFVTIAVGRDRGKNFSYQKKLNIQHVSKTLYENKRASSNIDLWPYIFQVITPTLRLNAKFFTSAVTTAKEEWPSTRSSVPTAPSSTKARTYELKEWYRDFVYFLNIAYRCNRNTCYYSENQKLKTWYRNFIYFLNL